MSKKNRAKQSARTKKLKREKKAKRKMAMYFIYAPLAYLIFLLTFSPYIVDLYQRPELWNGFLMVTVVVSFPIALYVYIRSQ